MRLPLPRHDRDNNACIYGHYRRGTANFDQGLASNAGPAGYARTFNPNSLLRSYRTGGAAQKRLSILRIQKYRYNINMSSRTLCRNAKHMSVTGAAILVIRFLHL